MIWHRRNSRLSTPGAPLKLGEDRSRFRLPVIFSVLLLFPGCPGGGPQQPILDHLVIPGYPPLAKGARVEGEVLLEYSIQPDGRVGGVRVVSGSHPLLDGHLTRAVQEWEYEPLGAAGPMTRQVTFRLRLEEAEQETQETTFDPPDRVEILARVRLLGPPE